MLAFGLGVLPQNFYQPIWQPLVNVSGGEPKEALTSVLFGPLSSNSSLVQFECICEYHADWRLLQKQETDDDTGHSG